MSMSSSSSSGSLSDLENKKFTKVKTTKQGQLRSDNTYKSASTSATASLSGFGQEKKSFTKTENYKTTEKTIEFEGERIPLDSDVKVKKIVHKPHVHEETIVQKHIHPAVYKENIVEVHKHPQFHEREIVDVKEERVREHAAKQREKIVHDTELHQKDIVQVHEHPEIKKEKVIEVHKHPESIDRKVVDVKEGHSHLVDKKGVKTKVLHNPKLHEKKVVELHEHPEIHHEKVVEVHKRDEALQRKVVDKKEVGIEVKTGAYTGSTAKSTKYEVGSTSRGLTGGVGTTGTVYEKNIGLETTQGTGVGMTGMKYEKTVEVGTTKGTGGLIGTESSMSSMSESSMDSLSGDDLKKHEKHKKHHHHHHILHHKKNKKVL